MMTIRNSTLNMMRLVLVAALMVLAVPVSVARGQCPAGWLPGEGVPGTAGTVRAVAVLPGGDFIVGGAFTVAGNAAVNNIARYNPTTGVWSALGSGVGGGPSLPGVYALAVLPGGDVIVGGAFSTAGGVLANNIARYNPLTEAWSALGSGMNGNVYALAVCSDGDLIVGGTFTLAGNAAANRIARYNPTTGVWSAMGSGVGGGPSTPGVFALAFLPSGDLIAGGSFTLAGDAAASNIARYNPTTAAWSALGSGTNGEIAALAVLPGGDIIVGGSFTMAGGAPASCITRYSPTIGVWSALGSGISGVSPRVRAVVVLPGGDVIVGGYFFTAGGVSARYIALYYPTTGVWSALGSGTNGDVEAFAVLQGGDVLLGGQFSTAGGVSASRIARYNPTTGVWSALASGTNSVVYALAVLPGGDMIVGGVFTAAGGVPANRIARYNPTTGVWSALGSGTNSFVRALAVLPGGDVIVGGEFTSAGGVPANNIARYNPVSGNWSALGSGTNSIVYALAVLPGGDVIVGGQFTSAGGVPVNRIARYIPSTGVWSALSPGVSGGPSVPLVYALAVLPGGDVLVGGQFTTAGGVSGRVGIARVAPNTSVWSEVGSGTNGAVYALTVLPGGDVVVGGNFTTAGGVAGRNRIARVNPTTGVWSAVGSGVSWPSGPPNSTVVSALAVLPGGDVIVGGNFTTAGGVAGRNRIARVNPTTAVWSALGSGMSGTFDEVRALAVLPGGDVVAGGDFVIAGGNVSAYLARYTFGAAAPTIGTQPVARVVCVGGSAEFVVTAVGTEPFTYQWRKGGAAIDTGVNPSAATGTLTLAGVGAGDAASYDCVVTSACGSVTSSAAVLTVLVCGCSPADVANTDGDPLPDGAIDNGDFNAFFSAFFLDQSDPGRLVADIASTDGEVAAVWPGGTAAGGPDGAIDNGDFNAFFISFFQSCP